MSEGDDRSIIDSRRAWLAAVGAGLAYAIGFGTVYSFGAFFDAMATEFDADRGSTALLFGVTLLAYFGFGIVSGPLSDRWGPRPVVLIGAAMMVAGLLLTAEVHQLWIGYLTYGIGVGVGGGWFGAPLSAVVGSLFDKSRTAALGVMATGSGLGTLVIVPLASRWIDAWGWRDAYRGLAVVAGVGLVVSAICLVRPPRMKVGTVMPSVRSFAADKRFQSMFTASFLMSVSLFVSFGFVVPFATDNGISTTAAARLIALIGLASIVGRLGLIRLAGRVGALRFFHVVLFIQPLAYVIWLFGGSNYNMLLLFAVVLGTSYGGFVAIAPAVGIDLFGLNGVGRMMGLVFLSFGVGGLIGPPAAGWLSGAVEGQIAVKLIALGLVVLAGVVSLGMDKGPEVVGMASAP